jgi:hypothetical protein
VDQPRADEEGVGVVASMRIVRKAIYAAASGQIVAGQSDVVNKICSQRVARLTYGQPNLARYHRGTNDYRMEIPVLGRDEISESMLHGLRCLPLTSIVRYCLEGFSAAERTYFARMCSWLERCYGNPASVCLKMQPMTRRHIEVPSSRAPGARGVEVQSCAIARQRRTSVVVLRVDRRPQIYRS